jgi:hypothetical protein
MSAVKGVYKTKYDAGASGDNVILEGVNGTVQCREDKYVASSLADASTIKVCADLPAGARIKRIEVTTPAFGTGRTLKIGTACNDDEFAGATSVATASFLNVSGSNYVIGTNAGDDEIMLTNAGTLTGTLYVNVYYTLA